MTQQTPSLPRLKRRALPKRGRPVRAPGVSRLGMRNGAIAMAVATAIALPAFAAPGEWDRFEIGNAGEEVVVLEPMPFERAGSSFPGSAFYYLQPDQPNARLGKGIHSDADSPVLQDRLNTGPAARAMRIDNSGVDRSRALQCLTAAVYYEAASEPDIGQRAVAQVVLNRVAHPSYPGTVCGVVYQGSQRKTGCQFSFTCDGSLSRKPSRMFWDRARDVAQGALGGYVHAPAGLSTHYHTVQIYPYWAPSLNYLGTIGAHRFYSFGGKAGRLSTFRFAYRGGEPNSASIKRSSIAGESSKALNPISLQRAFEGGAPKAASAAAPSAKPAPAPIYSQSVRERGGDTLYRGGNLPEATGIKPRYQNSGRWIARPGA